MKVVTIGPMPYRLVKVVGYCDDPSEPPIPGRPLVVFEPLRLPPSPELLSSLSDATRPISTHAFNVVEIRHPDRFREVAILAEPGAPLEWLPGWRPAPPGEARDG